MDPILSKEVLDFIKTHIPHLTDATPLCGDASHRKYYRLIAGPQTYVLMLGDVFKDIHTFPFLSVQRHFSKNGIQVPHVLSQAPALGAILLEDLGDRTLERQFWEFQHQKYAFHFINSLSMS